MASIYSLPKSAWISASEYEGEQGSGVQIQRPLPRPTDASDAAKECPASSINTNGTYGACSRQILLETGQPQDAPVTLYGRSVRRAALNGVDASSDLNSATSPHYRAKRALLNATCVEEVIGVLEEGIPNDPFVTSLAAHRLARFGRATGLKKVLMHPQWPTLLERLRGTLARGEARHIASAAWALSNLAVKDRHLFDIIADRCVGREPGTWDPMSLSLVAQSFASTSVMHPGLLPSITTQVQQEMSSAWNPGDLSRVAWSCAKLVHKCDTFFRDASCKILTRLPESTPTILVQTIWAFATVAPATVTNHFFPYAADAMERGGLGEFTPAHLAMVAWSFAAVLFRPTPLLEAIGDAVPNKMPQMNSQDITMIAWSYATLLAPERRVFDCLAIAAKRTIGHFNPQDLSNTAWAFATAGEYKADMFDMIADEACSRPTDFNGQHISMLFWAYVTSRHRHENLFALIGHLARVNQNSWHSAKLLAYSLASLPKLNVSLGSVAVTGRVATQLVDALLKRLAAGEGESDDAQTVHDAVLPWLTDTSGEILLDPDKWRQVDDLVSIQKDKVESVMRTSVVDNILAIPWWVYDEPVVREYQCAVQALGLRGLGSLYSWRFLRKLGVERAPHSELAALATESRNKLLQASSEREGRQGGRGWRANWCYWRAHVEVPSIICKGEWTRVQEQGRMQTSAVAGYREDVGGLVAVKLSHDHVSHRSWDCEFRAMARTAAAVRALAAGFPIERAQAFIDNGAAPSPEDLASSCVSMPACPARRSELEALARGTLEIYMTEVPCISCVGAMAQFRRRLPGISLSVAWDGMPRAGED